MRGPQPVGLDDGRFTSSLEDSGLGEMRQKERCVVFLGTAGGGVHLQGAPGEPGGSGHEVRGQWAAHAPGPRPRPQAHRAQPAVGRVGRRLPDWEEVGGGTGPPVRCCPWLSFSWAVWKFFNNEQPTPKYPSCRFNSGLGHTCFLSVCFSLCISLSLYHMYVSMYLYLSTYLYPSVHLSIHLSIFYLYLSIFIESRLWRLAGRKMDVAGGGHGQRLC